MLFNLYLPLSIGTIRAVQDRLKSVSGGSCSSHYCMLCVSPAVLLGKGFQYCSGLQGPEGPSAPHTALLRLWVTWLPASDSPQSVHLHHGVRLIQPLQQPCALATRCEASPMSRSERVPQCLWKWTEVRAAAVVWSPGDPGSLGSKPLNSSGRREKMKSSG